MSDAKRTVNIHGREYETVASRVQRFRELHPDHTICTEIVRLDDDQVVMKASILAAASLIATGHAQEFRKASQINATSYVENCETSAIGRALAAFGIAGTEFASANEVQNAIHQQKNPITPTSGAWDAIQLDLQNVMLDTADRVRKLIKRNDTAGAVAELEEAVAEFKGREDYMTAQWTRFDSGERRALKDGGFKFNAVKEAA